MIQLNRRDIIAALASIGAITAVPAWAQTPEATLDLSTGRGIGEAFLKTHPRTNVEQLRRKHLPNGLNREAVSRLRARSAADFRENRIFVHEGWRLSVTEAELFTLLNSAPR